MIIGFFVAAHRTASWKKGRDKLGRLAPLLGSWEAEADSKLGPVRYTRTFVRVLDGNWVQLDARWEMPRKVYEERALFGVGEGGRVVFHSFTSDGKCASGEWADGRDVHPDALAFVAEMPAGQARMVYWPGDGGAVNWAVEAKKKTGWTRFVHHVYVPAG